jgi:hypothetical protein
MDADLTAYTASIPIFVAAGWSTPSYAQRFLLSIDPAQKRYNTVPHSFRVFAE